MNKYNRRKRGTYKARIRKIKINDKCNAHTRIVKIKIHIRYDGYNKIQYDKEILRRAHINKAQKYVNITNAINDIFPDINAPHNAHTHLANSEYHKFIPQPQNYISYSRHLDRIPRYMRGEDKDTIIKDTRTVKCIILNDKDTPIYIGMMRRTRTVNRTQGTIHITLHKGKREYNAHERAVDPDMKIHGMTVREIRTHDVELYYE